MSCQSYAQNVTLWKHILRFEKGRYLPDGYIDTKYCYQDTTLIYEMGYSDNGWQIYDSIVYSQYNGVWFIDLFDATNENDSRLYYRKSDMVADLYYTNHDLHFLSDKYGVLPRYLNGINEVIDACKRIPPEPVMTYHTDTCCYSFTGVDHSLLFWGYGLPMVIPLYMYCCHIGYDGRYDWDKFSFSGYTFTRHFIYNKNEDIDKVVITRTDAITNDKIIWIESFFLMEYNTW